MRLAIVSKVFSKKNSKQHMKKIDIRISNSTTMVLSLTNMGPCAFVDLFSHESIEARSV